MTNCSRFRPVFAFLAAAPLMWAQQVQVREDRLTLPTYEDGAPSPNPQFPQFYNTEFSNYPYTIRFPENKIRHLTPWRAIIIENEYLSCRILPDLGGHLHGCTDKISGKEIFYSNPAIRHSQENPRSNFIATGIESSFPIAHSRVAGSPVDFAYSMSDGAGRVVVEDTDRTSGMEWRDEFILRPGSTVLEQRVTLHNSSAGRRGYHWWANAAVELDDPHLRILYPVKWMLPHGDGPMMPWPVNGSVDLSDAANHPKGIGLFAHGSNEPWMAIYKPNSRSGLVHYADPSQIKGKKIWLWGDGNRYVMESLTEKFNSYVEMQAGIFETQPEFSFLQPGEVKTFSHYWFPFRDLSGVSRATPDIVLNIRRTGGAATIEISATHVIPAAKIRVLNGEKPVFEAQADLDPKTAWTKAIDGAPAAVTVDVVNAAGASLMHHREGAIDALPFDRNAKNPEPVEPPAASLDPKTQTEAAYLARGAWHEQHDEFVLAWLDYRAGLAKFGDSEALAVAAGRTAFILNRKDDVVRLLATISHRPYQTEAAFYYGTTLAAGSFLRYEARNALNNAIRDPAFAMAARLQLAMLDAREGNMPEAVRVIQRLTAEPAPGSASEPRAPAQAGAVEVAILRRAGQTDAAKKRLEFWLGKDPANNMLRVEKTLLGGPEDAALWAHLAADPDRVLNLADQYAEIGAWQDAVALLGRKYPAVPANETEPGAVLPQDHALVAYYRGYSKLKLGQDPSADFAAAAALPILYIFPNRARTFDVLEAAIGKNANDANAHSLLGDLWFDSGETDQAIAEWRKALSLKKNIPSLHRNLGRALLDVKHDAGAARGVLQEGQRLFPEDGELRELLDRASAPSPVLDSRYFEVPLPSRAPTPAPAAAPAAPPKREAPAAAPPPPSPPPPAPSVSAIPVPGELADRALLGSPLEPERAIAMFSANNFPKDKQSNEVRRDYIEVQLQRLLARAHAGKCHDALGGMETLGDEDQNVPFTLYGFGAFMKAVHFQYYLGVIENVCGEDKAAKKRWSRMTKTSDAFESVDDVFPYLALHNLGENGWQQKIDAAIQKVHGKAAGSERPDLTFMEGSLLIAAGKRQEGDALLQKSFHSNEPMVQFLSLVAMRENSVK